MGRRNDDGTWQDSCLAKLKPGEPFFVLRAQDILASAGVRVWAARAKASGTPEHKVIEAIRTADEMEKWEPRKYPD
jgi:hypothetical protein